MSAEHLFDVVFEGRPLDDVPLKKAVIGLAKLLHKPPDKIVSLFNDQQTVLKRKTSKETASKYIRVLQKAGLACHIAASSASTEMGEKKKTTCPKCGFGLTGDAGSNGRMDECPACGIILEKFKPPDTATPSNPSDMPLKQKDTLQQGPEINVYDRFHYPGQNWLISLASLSFLLPESLELKAALRDLPPAGMGQRIWAAVSTFFHLVFMTFIMQLPVGIVAGLYLVFSNASLDRNFMEALRGVSFILGMTASLFLLPCSWRGHSFGQRAMGILPALKSDEDITDLSGPATLIRRLTFRTRCVRAPPLTSRPWNKALVPLAAIFVLHFIIVMPMGAMLGMINSSGSDSGSGSGKSHRTEMHVQNRPRGDNAPARTQNTLRQIHAAMSSYIVENGMTSTTLDHEVFEDVLNLYMPRSSTNILLMRLDEGNLKIEGELAEYRIGIYDNGQWVVIDERGNISRDPTF